MFLQRLCLAAVFRYTASLVTTKIGCVTWWVSKERLGQKEVLDRDETAMVFNVETTTTTTTRVLGVWFSSNSKMSHTA